MIYQAYRQGKNSLLWGAKIQPMERKGNSMKGTTKIVVATGLGVALGLALDGWMQKQPIYKSIFG